MNYYTSDLHLRSQRILQLCNRPFSSTDEMNQSIIRNINEVVSPSDTLYILGDVASPIHYAVPLLKQIGTKHIVLIAGNHDYPNLKHNSFRQCFSEIKDSMFVRDGEYNIVLSHYPQAEWNGYWQGNFHFYGHVHNNTMGPVNFMHLLPTAVNVGVDVNDFVPKTAQQLINEHFSQLRLPSVDMETFLENTIFCNPDLRNGTRVLDTRKYYQK